MSNNEDKERKSKNAYSASRPLERPPANREAIARVPKKESADLCRTNPYFSQRQISEGRSYCPGLHYGLLAKNLAGFVA